MYFVSIKLMLLITVGYAYKFSRYVISTVFTVDLLSTKFASSKFIEDICGSEWTEQLLFADIVVTALLKA